MALVDMGATAAWIEHRSTRAARRRLVAGTPALLAGVVFAASALAGEKAASLPEPANITGAPGAVPSGAPARAPWAREYAAGHWAAAVELLETIPEASRSGWHWLHLARAREKRGQLVESFATYERLHEVAADGGKLPGMKDVERLARAEGAALSNRIPWANVALEAVPVGALVYVDQQWLAPARLRLPYPVNPGWHTFLVESNGEVLAARRVYFEEGQSRVVPLSGWQAPSATTAPVAITPERPNGNSRARGAAAPASDAPPNAPERTWHPAAAPVDVPSGNELLTTAYVGLGVGALGAVIGTGFALAAMDTRERVDNAAPECGSNYACVIDQRNDAAHRWQTQTRAATISYAVGIVGLLTGGTAWVLHRQAARPATLEVANVELEPSLAPAGAAVSGRF